MTFNPELADFKEVLTVITSKTKGQVWEDQMNSLRHNSVSLIPLHSHTFLFTPNGLTECVFIFFKYENSVLMGQPDHSRLHFQPTGAPAFSACDELGPCSSPLLWQH